VHDGEVLEREVPLGCSRGLEVAGDSRRGNDGIWQVVQHAMGIDDGECLRESELIAGRPEPAGRVIKEVAAAEVGTVEIMGMGAADAWMARAMITKKRGMACIVC
jgi:hypothetical protein